MAEELRGIHYQHGPTATTDGVAILANSSDANLFVRAIHTAMYVNNNSTSPGGVTLQFGKNNATITTDGASGTMFPVSCEVETQAATGSKTINKSFYLAKGQFTLEPGETLYVNTTVDGTLDGTSIVMDVHYHY